MARNEKIFRTNFEAHYSLPTRWDKKIQNVDVNNLKIYVNDTEFFEARNLNIFTNYTLTFHNLEMVNKWRNKCDMSFYQNQLNFAVWCATTGCGVSAEHFNDPENLLSSVFRFHLYYQTRKILQEMSCPIPGDEIFNPTDNHINLSSFQKLCNEFNIKGDFRFKGGDSGGLGTMYNYFPRTVYRPEYHHAGYNRVKGSYDPNKDKFNISNTTFEYLKIDYIKQDAAIEGWKQFIEETSDGFTKAGIVRLDDSIRNYVHCILGSQAQTRANISKSPETQQYFIDLLEENIKSMFSIPESITQYQDAISKTNVKIDYVISQGLYMIPSDLILKIGTLVGYNNNIVVATKNMKIGRNDMVNNNQTAAVQIPIKINDKMVEKVEEIPTISPTYVCIGFSFIVFFTFYVFK